MSVTWMCDAIVSDTHCVCLDSILLGTLWCFVRVSEAMGYLTSGHGVNPSMGPLARRPVAQGPKVRYPTPSAMCEIMGQWFLMDELH